MSDAIPLSVGGASPELLQAIADAQIAVKDCGHCRRSRAKLCRRCAKGVLPQLAQPKLFRLQGKKPKPKKEGSDAPATTLPALGVPGRRKMKRLARAVAGHFTRTRIRRSA